VAKVPWLHAGPPKAIQGSELLPIIETLESVAYGECTGIVVRYFTYWQNGLATPVQRRV
jgi:hypothetical protein